MFTKDYSKYQPIIIILAIFLGLLASFNSYISEFCSYVEEPLLSVLLFFIFIEIDWGKFKKAFHNAKFLFFVISINFIWTPILAFLLGRLLLYNFTLQIALVLILVLPCTDWYLVFTDLTGGDVSLSSALLPLNLILQLILLPLYLFFMFHVNEIVHTEFIVTTFIQIIIPLLLSIIAQFILDRLSDINRFKRFFNLISENIEVVLLGIVAFAINASEGQQLFNLPSESWMFVTALLIFYITNFSLGLIISHLNHYSVKETISFIFLITARNTPLSLSLAGLIFPTNTLLTLILLIGPLTELPISYIESIVLRLIYRKELRG